MLNDNFCHDALGDTSQKWHILQILEHCVGWGRAGQWAVATHRDGGRRKVEPRTNTQVAIMGHVRLQLTRQSHPKRKGNCVAPTRFFQGFQATPIFPDYIYDDHIMTHRCVHLRFIVPGTQVCKYTHLARISLIARFSTNKVSSQHVLLLDST